MKNFMYRVNDIVLVTINGGKKFGAQNCACTWVPEMDQYVGNGHKYRIASTNWDNNRDIPGYVFADDGSAGHAYWYTWDERCLQLYDDHDIGEPACPLAELFGGKR